MNEARRAIIKKYARLTNKGWPMTCVPSKLELSSGKNKAGWGTDGKVIFNSMAKAMGAALELEQLGGVRLWAYECGRSRAGHVHLTSKRPGSRRRRPPE